MFDGRDPIYRQIAEAIRSEILSGALLEGDQVMSTTQYATTFRINPATAAKAFNELVDEGVLFKQRGVGMFVTAGAAHHLRVQRRTAFFSQRLAPILAEAAVLGIGTTELTAYITEHSTQPPQPTRGRVMSGLSITTEALTVRYAETLHCARSLCIGSQQDPRPVRAQRRRQDHPSLRDRLLHRSRPRPGTRGRRKSLRERPADGKGVPGARERRCHQ